MKIIGITGKSGSGKTTIASMIAKKINGIHLDIDKIGHEALQQEDVIKVLCDQFGTKILNSNKVDRKKLGNIVFAKKEKMKQLEDITWNYMKNRLDNILSRNEKYIILDWALLPQTSYWNKCDFKILVESDYNKRKDKVIERDNISEEYFNKRDSASVDYSKFEFDYILKNDYNLQTLEKTLENLF